MNRIVSGTFSAAASLAIVLGIFWQGATGTAQQDTSDQTRIEVQVNLVNVLFTVTDKKGRFVVGMNEEDIRVFEDGVPQEIRFFSRESNLPLRLGVLIDTSNSVRGRLRFEQQAAIDFLQKAIRPKWDQAFVVSFDVEAELVQDITYEMEELVESIRSLQVGGTTRLYDAIYFASKEKLLLIPKPEPYIRRALIILSDGIDNQSEYSREEVLAMAQRAEVILYTISTNRTGIFSRGDKVLKLLTRETGGLAFSPFNVSEMNNHFNSIAQELRSQYSLGYVSTNQKRDGTFRRITFKPENKRFRIRVRSGYFAPSE